MEADAQVHQEPPEELAGIADGSACMTSSLQATLPLRVSQKWVSYACRMAGVEKPRWNRYTSTWTTTGPRENGITETITITRGSTPNSVTINVAWVAPEGTSKDTATARRLVTSFFTGMQWAERYRKRARTSEM
jgi:hypothetical protein